MESEGAVAMPDRLRCEVCGRESEGRAEGWRAPHGREDDDAVVAVVLCPDCAREIDGSG